MEKINKNSGIYAIKNKINGKMYIGSSVDIYQRKRKHLSELKRGVHNNKHLQASFNKYGEESFDWKILQRKISKREILTYERNFIIAFNTLNNGYNQCLPNIGGGHTLTESGIEKCRRARYIQLYGDLIESDYLLWRNKIIEKKNKPKLTFKEKKNLFRKKFGKKVYAICIKTNQLKYIFNSTAQAGEKLGWAEAVRTVIDKPTRSYKGYRLTSIYNKNKDYRKINKIKYTKKGCFKGYPLKCINIETKEEIVFNNKYEAIEQLNFTKGGISKVLCGLRKSHKGHTFKLIKKSPIIK